MGSWNILTVTEILVLFFFKFSLHKIWYISDSGTVNKYLQYS